MGTITVFASGNKAEIKNVVKQHGKAMVDALRERLSDSPAPVPAAPAAPAPAAPEVMAQLKQLGELKAAGVVSQDEFDTREAQLLERL